MPLTAWPVDRSSQGFTVPPIVSLSSVLTSSNEDAEIVMLGCGYTNGGSG